MESLEAPLRQKLRINYTVLTHVTTVKDLEGKWFVHFDGSRESIAFGTSAEPAPFNPGDQVKITFEKV